MPTTQDHEHLEWTFPLSGIDRQEEFQEQPALTTPAAVNVRAFEPSSDRGRGGSRPGLSKHLPQIPEGAEVIQHLKQIVDPQGPLTGLSFNEGDPTTPDTSSGGRNLLDDASTRLIRVGGSGYYTHPETDQTPDDEDNPIALRQYKVADLIGDTDVTLDDVPLDDSVIVVAVRQIPDINSGAVGIDVRNDAAVDYARVGLGEGYDGYVISEDADGAQYAASVWTHTASESALDQVVRVLASHAGDSGEIIVMEFRRVDAGTPVASKDHDAVDQPDSVPPQPDPEVLSLTMTGANQMAMLVWFSVGSGSHTWTHDFTSSTLISAGASGLALKVRYKIGIVESPTITLTPDTTTPPTNVQSGLVAYGLVFAWSGE